MRRLSSLVAIALLAVACGKEEAQSDSSSAGAIGGASFGQSSSASSNTGTEPVASQGGASSGVETNPIIPGGQGGATAGGTTGGQTAAGGNSASCSSPTQLGVHLVGRYDECALKGVKFSWSGSGFVASFSGTGISAKIREAGKPEYYTVVVDGVVQEPLLATGSAKSYTLASGLEAGTHRVELYRRNEPMVGVTVVEAIEVTGGALLDPPAAPERLIEVVGDSITCGYGNEGTTKTCPFSADTENHYLTYGAILARQFSAEVSTVAWSGRGIVSNYNGDTASPTMPEIYGRALGEAAASRWDFRTKPQLVIINLGTNDYSTDNDPTDEDFTKGYLGLLEQIRSHYENAHILCTLGPLLAGTDLETARKNIAAAVATRLAAGDTKVSTFDLEADNPEPGCDYHPNLATHDTLAKALAPEVSRLLGW